MMIFKEQQRGWRLGCNWQWRRSFCWKMQQRFGPRRVKRWWGWKWRWYNLTANSCALKKVLLCQVEPSLWMIVMMRMKMTLRRHNHWSCILKKSPVRDLVKKTSIYVFLLWCFNGFQSLKCEECGKKCELEWLVSWHRDDKCCTVPPTSRPSWILIFFVFVQFWICIS